eukprot:CAMPEP_0202693634 /NCGR_PEP_ID=MMETSP1385-20130828/7683_1 /ASSEMBLY_ACC=CAM_ASM_000861 /TAXON_ID=933848 /ORGANISM="Elphidium margaritaceum" /LENGTH=116 /DNA_ID=CAMNT_0049349331 /DNA_START=111 /DNA_END=458 /DNA_ORIENTATION=-
MATQSDPNQIGKAFLQHYYATFDGINRNNLASLFNDKSMMTYEGSQHMGQKSIMEKLTTLQFKKCRHDSKTMDVQPSGAGGLMIVVTGDIFVDDGKNGIKYSEVFHLMKGQNNSFW